MRYSIQSIAITGLFSTCLAALVSPATLANTGSAITGDDGAGNPDSSSFTGSFFDPPSFGGSVKEGPFTGVRQRPNHWKCNIPYKNEEGSRRFKTVATMLSTNLAGTESWQLLEAQNVLTSPNGEEVISNQGPLFSCADSLTLKPAGEATATNLSRPMPQVSSSSSSAPTGSSAALLGGEVQPTGQPLTGATTANSGEVSAPSVSLVDYFNSPYETNYSFVDAGAKVQKSLQESLKLPSVPNLDNPFATADTDPQVIKSKTLRDLITTLQGLTTEKTLLGDPQGESLVDVNQFAAAIKTYNQLLSLLDYPELQAWSQDRYGQDITATLKKLRTTCNCGWADSNTTAAVP